ncbi:MAG: aminotransferase class V-fold PLP-dependent enzyme [Planctomycetota bacterium]
MIYLDHASTSFPKPIAVREAVQRWLEELGVDGQRGDGPTAALVRDVVADTRARIGARCGLAADRVAFTSGATESLNLFLRGFLRPGAAVLTTELEHSSVVRPLNALRAERDLDIEILPVRLDGTLELDLVEERLRARPRDLLAFSHASNVLGTVLPAAELCTLARTHGCTTLLDASQSAGAVPFAVGADAIAASAHKGLLAPPGLGFLAVQEGVVVRPSKQGGTGSAAALEDHPPEWPAAFEAGTPNTPAIFGLHAALHWLDEHPDAHARAASLLTGLRDELAARPGTRIFGPPSGDATAILSFVLPDLDPAEVGALLAEANIIVRTGFHCAPWLHRRLGTEAAGTVRVSAGPCTSEADIAAVATALG